MNMDSKLFTCKICHQDFKHLPSLSRHKKTYHNTSNSSGENECKVCFKIFSRQDALNRHVPNCKGPSSQNNKENKCSTCNKVFGKISNLLRHMPLHEKM